MIGFFKINQRKLKKGFSLDTRWVRNIRVKGKPRQETILYLGSLRIKDHKVAAKSIRNFNEKLKYKVSNSGIRYNSVFHSELNHSINKKLLALGIKPVVIDFR